MKQAFGAWSWSLGVLARSPALLLSLAALVALWCWAGYEWLWIPESSSLVLLLSGAWAIAQVLVAVAVIAGIATSAAQAAASGDRRLPLRSFWGFHRRQFVHSLLLVVVSLILVTLIAELFAWVNRHSIEVASFLTFHSQKPVSHVVIEKICAVVESLIWIALAGFLLTLLIVILRGSWQQVRKQCGRILASCCFKTSFFSGLLSVAVFGGLSYLLSNWHPKVPPGFWDHTQMVVRLGLALMLIVVGGLFWMLSLARLTPPTDDSPPS